MLDKNNTSLDLYKAYELSTFLSTDSHYRSLDTAFAAIYLDYSLYTIPYESIKDSYESLRKSFTDIYLDYSSLNSPYECLKQGFDSVIK